MSEAPNPQEFVDRAAAEGLVDVAVSALDTPIGPLLVAGTDQGIVRIGFLRLQSQSELMDELATAVSPRVLETEHGLSAALEQLDGYFTGDVRGFDVDIDWRLSHGFRRAILQDLVGVGYGETCSYGELARRAGNPGASRAVGSAMATNPIPVVVPCHRVLRSDGSVGGYAGGPDVKERLLQMEASLS